MRWTITLSVAMMLLALAPSAQTTSPQQDDPPPDPTYPNLRLGVLSYFQYAADLESRNRRNEFDVTRSYINLTGDLTPHVRFRVTPDLKRQTSGELAGSLVFRLKYAFVEFDGLRPGAWLRFGAHHTPWLDFAEHVNRYRVQGTVFAEREGIIPGSSDFGVGYSTPLPGNYGEMQVGVYNGEGYTQAEANARKSLQGRLTVRPLPNAGLLRHLRLTGYYNLGWFDADLPRRHGIVMAHYEHPQMVASVEWLVATERPTLDVETVERRRGSSVFLEVREGLEGWAGWVRIDRFDPNVALSHNARRRLIAAVAYWLDWSDVRLGLVISDEDEHDDRGGFDTNRVLAQVHMEF